MNIEQESHFLKMGKWEIMTQYSPYKHVSTYHTRKLTIGYYLRIQNGALKRLEVQDKICQKNHTKLFILRCCENFNESNFQDKY